MVILSEIFNNIHFIQITLSSMQRFLKVKALTITKPAWNNNCDKNTLIIGYCM